MRSAEQRLPAFIFPSFPEKGSSLFLGELVGIVVVSEVETKENPELYIENRNSFEPGVIPRLASF